MPCVIADEDTNLATLLGGSSSATLSYNAIVYEDLTFTVSEDNFFTCHIDDYFAPTPPEDDTADDAEIHVYCDAEELTDGDTISLNSHGMMSRQFYVEWTPNEELCYITSEDIDPADIDPAQLEDGKGDVIVYGPGTVDFTVLNTTFTVYMVEEYEGPHAPQP